MTLITKPGVYDIPIDAYHNVEICDAPSISGSGLVDLAPPDGEACDAPIKYWQNSTLNPDRERKDTKALRVGKCAHTLFLEGMDAVQKAYVIDNLPRAGEGSGNALKAFKAKAEQEGKVIIRAESNATELGWNDIQAMVKAMARYPLMRAAFADARTEPTLAWRDAETGVWLRGRPDRLPNDPVHVPEYKTARSAMKPFFERQIDDFGYHIKAAHIMDGIRALGLGDPKTFTHWVQETKPPFLMKPHTLPRETLEWAEVQRRAAIRTFARCLDKNDWPGYPDTVEETGLPAYKLARLTRMDLTGTQHKGNDNEPTRRPAEDYLRA